MVPEGQLWSGMPAKYERALTESEILKFATIVEENLKINHLLALETNKTWEQIEKDKYEYEQENDRAEYYNQRATPEVKLK